MTNSPLSGVGGGSYIDRTVDKVSFVIFSPQLFLSYKLTYISRCSFIAKSSAFIVLPIIIIDSARAIHAPVMK